MDQQRTLLAGEMTRKKKQPSNPWKKSKAEQWAEVLLDKLTAFFWLSVALAVIYLSNFFHNLFYNQHCNRPLLQVAFFLYAISFSVILYAVLYVGHIKGVKQPIDEYNPSLVYLATFCGVVGSLLLLLGIWPIWGFKSLLIIIIIMKGFFTLTYLMPAGPIGQLLFIAINVIALFSFYWIEHEGYIHH